MPSTSLSITRAIEIFGDCLRSLIPHVSKLGIEWEQGKSYDDWDLIASALFSAIVERGIAYSVEGEKFAPLAPYDLKISDYETRSFLFDESSGQSAPFLRLEKSQRPFDTAVFTIAASSDAQLGGAVRIPLTECRLVVLLRLAHEQRLLQSIKSD